MRLFCCAMLWLLLRKHPSGIKLFRHTPWTRESTGTRESWVIMLLSILSRLPLIIAQCQSIPIKIQALIQNTSIRCMNLGIHFVTSSFKIKIPRSTQWILSMSIIADQCRSSQFLPIDRHWPALGSITQFWLVLIGIGQWSRESCYMTLSVLRLCDEIWDGHSMGHGIIKTWLPWGS